MLNQEQFEKDIRAAFVAARNSNADEEKSLDEFVRLLTGTLIKHIKTLEIVYTNGLNAPNGLVTGTINHSVK